MIATSYGVLTGKQKKEKRSDKEKISRRFLSVSGLQLFFTPYLDRHLKEWSSKVAHLVALADLVHFSSKSVEFFHFGEWPI